MDLITESRMGLKSIFTFKCKMCGVIEKVPTENPNAESNVNMLVVSGIVSVGIGYSQVNELLSAMDIPCMAETTYQKYFEKVSVEIKHAAWEKIQDAAKEEAELAKAVGDVNEDGIPVITVIADGAWSKRSYRTNYNAASGVACVIGAKTKKLYFWVYATKNQIPLLKNNNIYEEIMKRTRRMADTSWSLLHNMDNNLAESYREGGKRINFSLKGSYETRCTGAALSFNSDGNYHEVLQKRINKCGPGKFTTTYCERIKRIKLCNSKRRVFKKRRREVAGPDLNYGVSIDDYPDINEKTFGNEKNKFLDKISKTDAQQLEIDTLSESWKRERKLRLTASNFGRICCMRPTASTAKTVEALLYSKFLGNECTVYGQENEQNAVDAFEAIYGIKTKFIGLCVDREKPYLAASPDRLTEIGNGILEIKCPASCKNITPEF